jgi:hypothetical protein
VIDIRRGWHVAPADFAERQGLIIRIALGESSIAIGVSAEFHLEGSQQQLANLPDHPRSPAE